MELLFLFMDRSALVSQLTFVMRIIKVRFSFIFYLAFAWKKQYTWHLIFSVPSVCYFPCCEQIHSNVWVCGEEIIIRTFSKKVNSVWHLNALGR